MSGTLWELKDVAKYRRAGLSWLRAHVPMGEEKTKEEKDEEEDAAAAASEEEGEEDKSTKTHI